MRVILLSGKNLEFFQLLDEARAFKMQESISIPVKVVPTVAKILKTSTMTEKIKNQQNLASQPALSETLKSTVNQLEQLVEPFNGKNEDLNPQLESPEGIKTEKVALNKSTADENHTKRNSQKNRNSTERKFKREISLVLDQKTCRGYVGFSNLPNQVYRKAVKKGFDFTLMVVGESGLGKSTLINSMFLTDIYLDCKSKLDQPIEAKTLDIKKQKVKLSENDVHLTLTVVDTPGV